MSFQRKRPDSRGAALCLGSAVYLESDEIVEWLSGEIVRTLQAIQRRADRFYVPYITPKLLKTIAVPHRLGESYARASIGSAFLDASSQTRR